MTKFAPEKPERIVLDTNVLFSALAFSAERPPGKVLELGKRGAVEIFISAFILEELVRALGSVKMRWELERIARTVKQLRAFTRQVEPSMKVDAIGNDETDNRIIECALEAEAQVLVTGNMKHIRPLGHFRGIEIITPREFMDRYFPAAA
ncbi:MAG: putative toxin-antitoxin system toxin component, PIN family [Elusimicrobiota bacterium]